METLTSAEYETIRAAMAVLCNLAERAGKSVSIHLDVEVGDGVEMDGISFTGCRPSPSDVEGEEEDGPTAGNGFDAKQAHILQWSQS